MILVYSILIYTSLHCPGFQDLAMKYQISTTDGADVKQLNYCTLLAILHKPFRGLIFQTKVVLLI